ncbi:MAG TPA: VOC family protein [Actinomycetota bacterium]|nr:VOC family protein [Actinomycetota bacterium]
MAEAKTQTTRAAVPMISYEDVAAAVDWLTNAFGFRETGQRYTDEEGRVTHAELELDGALVYLGWPGPEYQGPDHHAKECDHARTWLNHPYVIDGVHIYVDDLDAHYERAKQAGARILREPQTEPYGRLYNAADLEGHRWMFMQA